MQLTDTCITCLLDKKVNGYPKEAAPEQVAQYKARVRQAILENRTLSSPEMHVVVAAIYRDIFGPEPDFTDIKRRFNALMLELEPAMNAEVDRAQDPLKRAVQYAMVGNYIDFSALENVDEGELKERLAASGEMTVAEDMLAALRSEIMAAGRLAYFTDNCGEIVADKALLRVMRRMNPALEVTVIVRGAPVVNDATLEDAAQVGMAEVAHRVMGNGTEMPGIVLQHISAQSLAAVEAADVLIAKGQANYEGLCGCGLNIFYIFMCKCDMFTNRFGVPRFSGLLTREKK